MKNSVDRTGFHADILIGWREIGFGPYAHVTIWDGGECLADVPLDFPSAWNFELCLRAVAVALDGAQQLELIEPAWKAMWDELSRYCV